MIPPTAQIDRLIARVPGTWAVLLADEQGAPRYARNQDLALPSASLIKVPLAWQFLTAPALAGACHLRAADICDDEGSLAALVGQTLPWRELGRRMIVESENSATNLLLARLGGIDGANQWLAHAGYQRTRWRRRMLDFAARAAGRDNTTSAGEIAAMLARIARLERAGDPAASQLTEWLLAAEPQGKLEAGLPPATPLAHKTGDLPDVEHDAGIITAPDGSRYVLAVLATQIEDAAAARATIAAISRACWGAAAPGLDEKRRKRL